MTTVVAHKVLIIDDDTAFSTALARWLADVGFDASTAADAQEAFVCVQADPPDAIILDLNLCYANGDELVAFFADVGIGSVQSVPIVVLSGVDEIEANWRATKLGAFACLHKPVELDRLGRLISCAIESRVARTAA